MSQIDDLQNQYNSILTQYQQTYQDYIQSLDPSTSSMMNFTVINNASFLGESEISSQQVTNINDCVNSCSAEATCSGANYNNNSQLCSLRTGTNNVITSQGSESAIVPMSLKYKYELKNLNQQLLSLNQQISQSLQNSFSDYQTNVKPQEQQHQQILTNNNNILQEDRMKIEQIIREQVMLNEVKEDSEIVVSQEYSKYIVYLLVAILMIILVIKFSVFTGGNQRGGGFSRDFYKDFFVLFGVYLVGFTILHFLHILNEVSVLFLFFIMYCVFQMKLV